MDQPQDDQQAGQSIPVNISGGTDGGTLPTTPDETIVPEAEPQQGAPEVTSATQDLASVASELQSMDSASMQADSSQAEENTPAPVQGVDPMEQIQAQQAVETEPVQEAAPAEQEVMAVPVVSEPVAEVPPSEPTATSSVESLPVAQPVPEQPAADSSATDSASQNASSGGLISDVIAPSAVATAVAEGIAGQNAVTGTPETASTQMAQVVQPEMKPAKKSSKKGTLVLVVILVTLLLGGGAFAAYYFTRPKDSASSTKSSSSATTSTSSDSTKTDTSVEAATLDDYKAACDAKSVSNASEYKGAAPHSVVVFEKGSDDKFAQSVVAFSDKTWAADSTKVTSTQLVACISKKAATETKLKTCPITDAATKVTTNVDYYSVTYVVDVYNAKTGAKVATYDSPSATTTCPTTATYDKAAPKIYAPYGITGVETLIKDLVTKTV